ncbi:unnamed protein product [Caenorhabditis sp. 36 PRJEB53466]|nr:unnamed protein product [Caenorhabditis sp. 36 PRJEB53466]
MRIAVLLALILLSEGVTSMMCPSFFNGTADKCDEIQCLNGGFVNSDKTVCICPPGYLGIHCEAVKTSLPPENQFRTSENSFNIININLLTQFWGFKTYSNIRAALSNHFTAFANGYVKYNLLETNSNSVPYLDGFDLPQYDIQFADVVNTVNFSLSEPTDTGLYWCYQVPIYEQIVSLIRSESLRNTVISIVTQHPPSFDGFADARETALAFGVRVNVLWISDKTFMRCEPDEVTAFKSFVDITGGLFVQLRAKDGDVDTQTLITQVLQTHYKPQYVSIQSFPDCSGAGNSVPVVIDPNVQGPYNFFFLGDNANPSQSSFVSCFLRQPVRSFDNQLAVFQSPDPTCSSLTITTSSGSCTAIVFTNAAPSGPLDLAIYTTYVEDQSIDSSRYAIIESVPFYPAFHVEAATSSSGSQLIVNSIFGSDLSAGLTQRSPAAYEWITNKPFICNAGETQSLFLNISVDSSVVQRAVRVACVSLPPVTTVPVDTTTSEAASTSSRPLSTSTVGVESSTSSSASSSSVSTDVSGTSVTSTTDSSSSSTVPDTSCHQPAIKYTFLFAYSTELDASTYGLVSATVIQALKNYPYNGTILRDAYLDSTNATIQKPSDIVVFSSDLQAKLPSAENALGENSGSNAVSIVESLIATTDSLENSVILLLPNRLPTATSSDLSVTTYTDFVNKNVKVFTVISLASLIGQYSGRTGAYFNKQAASTNGHYIVANETIGRDVNSDYNKIVSQVMQFGYGQDLLFSRNIGRDRLQNDIGTVRIPHSDSGFVNVTITVSLSVVDTNAPSPPNRLLLAFKPPVGFDTPAIPINFLTDSTVTRYDSSNFYITTISIPAGNDHDLVLQYVPNNDENDLLIRMWTDRNTYHTADYADLSMKPIDPNDKEGAALRITVKNSCYESSDSPARILITDCNGDVSTVYDTDQSTVSNLTASDRPGKYFAFVPFFCNQPSTSESCISGTENKYDVQFNFDDYSVTRSFLCSKSSEAFDPKCTNQDVYGNYQCTGNSPFMRGPTGKVADCTSAKNGRLVVNYGEAPGEETYSCDCYGDYQPPNCAAASCSDPNTDPLANDNSWRTFTIVLVIDAGVSTFSVVQEDVAQFLRLEAAIPSIWKYQLLTYCADGSVTNLYSGGAFDKFNASLLTTSNVECSAPAQPGAVDLTKVYQTAVRGLGRNVRGLIALYTESSEMIGVDLSDFIAASRTYRQELFVFTGTDASLVKLNDSISEAALSTGGFLVQTLISSSSYLLTIDKTFVPSILAGKTSLAYLSTQQSDSFNVQVTATGTVVYVVTWGSGDQFSIDNTNSVDRTDCQSAGNIMAMCRLTNQLTYKFNAASSDTPYTVAVFITNEDDLSPSFQIISDLGQDASNAVSTSTSDTRTIVSMYVPPQYVIVNNDGDGGLTRTIKRTECLFGYTAYSVFANSKYSAGTNTAVITLQKADANAADPKYTRYFAFGTTDSPSCQNNGTVLASSGSCACLDGFQGPDCSLVACSQSSVANAWADVCVCSEIDDVACANRYSRLFY